MTQQSAPAANCGTEGAPTRSRLRPWISTAAVLVALPVIVAVIYVMLVRAAQGDYLLNELYATHHRLVANPLPRVSLPRSLDDPGQAETLGDYWPTGRGVILSMIPYRDRSSKRGTITEEVTAMWRRLPLGVSYRYHPDVPHYLITDASNHLGSHNGVLERYDLNELLAMRGALGTRDMESALAAARVLREKYPRRTTPILWEIGALCALGRRDEAAEVYASCRAVLLADSTYRGEWYPILIDNDLLAAEEENRFQLAAWRAMIPEHVESQQNSFEVVARWVGTRADCPPPRSFTLLPWPLCGRHTRDAVRIAQHHGLFDLLRGDRDEGFRMLLGALMVGYQERFFTNLDQLGDSHRTAAGSCDALTSYLVHGDLTVDELESCWELLERAVERLPDATGMIEGWEFPAAPLQPISSIDELQSDGALGAFHFWLFGQAELQLLRESIRARHYRLRHGVWPTIGSDGSLLGLELATDRAPFDPFAGRDAPLRAVFEGANLIIYSIGPDLRDDKVTARTQCMLGTVSFHQFVGDWACALGPEPTFRFPRESEYTYKGMADFDARYPTGLPHDPSMIGMQTRLELTSGAKWVVSGSSLECDLPVSGSIGYSGENLTREERLYPYGAGLTKDRAGEYWVELAFSPANTDVSP